MIADKIKSIREKEGLTQDDLARELFVSRTTVAKWETGKCLPNIYTLRMISEKYGISLDKLIHDEDESMFYKRRKIKYTGMELTKKQKIITLIVFYTVLTLFYVIINVTSVTHL